MSYITVNYGLNQIYNVHTYAIKQIIEHTISKFKNIKLIEEVEVFIVNGGKSVESSIKIDVINSKAISDDITNLSSSIEDSVKTLINTKPSNVKIKINSIS
ncbi:MAG: hypothetical protein GY679_05125 [Mycoplasma sp.]|nr:hypothetical protein [Mycoplasma sp.]